jgi:hypothetical protein
MVTSKVVKIDSETDELLFQARKEFLKHHPELNKIPISYNKIIHEISKFYIQN